MRSVVAWLLATAAAVAVPAAADEDPRREVPQINVGGIVNAASNIPAPDNFISPGAIISIYGSGLSNQTIVATPYAYGDPALPSTLGGVSVFFGPVEAPLFFVSPQQINAQAPTAITPGVWEVKVKFQNLAAGEKVVVQPYSPGLFAVARHADGALVTRDAPARPGEYIVFFGAGFGWTTPRVESGRLSPPGPTWMDAPVEAKIGDIPLAPADIYYSGLAPGFVGLYQFNLRIPPAAPSGELEVRVKVDEYSPQGIKVAEYWSQSGMRITVQR